MPQLREKKDGQLLALIGTREPSMPRPFPRLAILGQPAPSGPGVTVSGPRDDVEPAYSRFVVFIR